MKFLNGLSPNALKVLKALGVVIGLVLLLAGIKASQIMKMIASGKHFAPPPESVLTAEVMAESWEASFQATGSLSAVQGAVLRAESSGTVKKIAFESGNTVEKGTVLIELDTGTEDAKLLSSKARLDLTELNLDRARSLSSKKVNATAELDTAEMEAKLAVAEWQSAKAMLDKKIVRAPFGGRTGVRLVNLGQWVREGDPLVSLQDLNSIFADFFLPEQRLQQLKAGLAVRVSTDTYPGKTFLGVLTAVNPDVESRTRSVRMQATLPNPDGELRSGLFAQVTVLLEKKEDVLAIPATAVVYAPYGDSVFVVESQKDERTGQTALTARQQFVRLGKKQGDFVAVTSGLKAKETVVSTGAFKLRNGVKVVLGSGSAIQPSRSPSPSDS